MRLMWGEVGGGRGECKREAGWGWGLWYMVGSWLHLGICRCFCRLSMCIVANLRVKSCAKLFFLCQGSREANDAHEPNANSDPEPIKVTTL